MGKDFRQTEWDARLREDWQHLLDLDIRLDLDRLYDWTSVALIDREVEARVAVVARCDGIIAGLPAAEMVVAQSDRRHRWTAHCRDGDAVAAGTEIATIEGPARNLLTCERVLLNVLGHLSGIATLTRAYVKAVAGTRARVYDTRKTTPGWRRLEKYAVRCGGGRNHRTGLYDAVLIKDNHLAIGAACHGQSWTAADAVRRAKQFLKEMLPPEKRASWIIEVELDSIDRLDDVLAAEPDIVLLDNLEPKILRQAVARRDAVAPQIELEASGGITLENIGDIARSGVDRISVGALTHSAPALDIGLDWKSL